MEEAKKVAKVLTLDEEAIRESEKAKPTSEPAYWAKRSCNRCYGRGIVGNVERKVDTNTVVVPLLCNCANRNFGKWREEWIKQYKLHHTAAGQNVDDVPVPVIPESATIVDNPA
jgi:hypothetical protein